MAINYVTNIKEACQDVLNKLRTMTDESGNLLFNTVSMYNNQVENQIKNNSGYSTLFPAALLEIKETSSENWLTQSSTMDIRLIVHLYHQQLDGYLTGDNLDQNFNVFLWKTYIKGNFTGINIVNLTTLQFDEEKQDPNHGNVYHFQVIFKSKLVDNSANPFINGKYAIKKSGDWRINSTVVFKHGGAHGIGFDAIGINDIIG